jgi:hypothetical protein
MLNSLVPGNDVSKLQDDYCKTENHNIVSLPVFLGLPNEANHSPPLLQIVGATATVSTLVTVVGQPNTPTSAGKGGFNLNAAQR